jgi:hypothetical protein
MQEGVNQFADVAAQFCRFIDHRREFGAGAFVRECARLLSTLYLLAIELPDVSVGSTGTPSPVVSHETAVEIARDVGNKLGDYNIYWLLFDPFEVTEPVAGELSDDLTDIYKELLEGLSVFRAGSDQQRLEAIWHWRFGFEVHWGRHLVAALRPIQSILVGHLVGG